MKDFRTSIENKRIETETILSLVKWVDVKNKKICCNSSWNNNTYYIYTFNEKKFNEILAVFKKYHVGVTMDGSLVELVR